MTTSLSGYDAVYSIGTQCACAMYLNKCGLRTCAGPLDWIMGVPFEQRIDLILNNFQGFLEKKNLKKLPPSKQKKNHDNYIDEGTKFILMHDFKADGNFEDDYAEVKDKYDRRIARFLNILHSPNKKVLLVLLDFKNHFEKKRFLPSCNRLLRSCSAQIDILIITPEAPSTTGESPVWQKVKEHVYNCSAQINIPGSSDYMGNTEVLSGIFKQLQAGGLNHITFCAKPLSRIKRLFLRLKRHLSFL